MMNDMSLKAKIRNIAKKKRIPAQLVLQNYLFERFLQRLSVTEYREKFVIKGGALISSIVGLEPIRDDDFYGGYKVSIIARFGKIEAPMSMDISTGDIMTPGAEKREFVHMFSDDTFTLWTYNIETILGEKVETILSRNIYSTRPRDFYDVYALEHTQEYNKSLFEKALSATANHRNSTETIKDVDGIINTIEKDPDLQRLWKNYTKQYTYASEITFEQIIVTLKEILENIKVE